MSVLRKSLLALFAILFSVIPEMTHGQDGPVTIGGEISYANPQIYRIAGVTVRGAQHTDVNAIRLFTGLEEGQEIQIPGEVISKAIENLWDQRLFEDVKIYAADIRGKDIYLLVDVKEVPVLSRFSFPGVTKSEADNLRERIKLIRGTMVNENLITTTEKKIVDYFIEKGYLNTSVEITQSEDPTLDNSVELKMKVDKGERTKISEIVFVGAEQLPEKKLRKALRNTKKMRWWSIFKSSKYIPEEFAEDRSALVSAYNGRGFRNMKLLSDSIYPTGPGTIGLQIDVSEGSKFYFRNITFSGNQKYSTEKLEKNLGIDKGDVYDATALQERVVFSPAGTDISSLYQDDGYLNFSAIPVEALVQNDSIDIDIQIREGKQFRIGNVSVTGNTKTNDHVIYREIRTRPGDLFNRTNIIRTQRELAQLGYFNPEAFNVKPTQNPEDGTVDLEYVVEEKPSDQIELSGGWGAGRIVGTLGVSFTNFSMRNLLRRGSWNPVPSGDGQRLSIRAQTNGAFFQSYSMAFTEPWLGGKKPNALSISVSHSVQTNGLKKTLDNGLPNPDRSALLITGASVGLGKRLKKPDDYFLLYAGISYQHFDLNNFGSVFSFADGQSNNLALSASISRNSLSDPIYPQYGSNIKLSFKGTAPYSAFNNVSNYAELSDQEKYKWMEYHKWKFTADWYTPLDRQRKAVLNTKIGFGFLGAYNRDLGISPFERFYMGGVFLSGFILDGREIINLRGYDDNSISPDTGNPIIAKYGMELRYLLSPNPNAKIYALGFAEAGRTWESGNAFSPFSMFRSAGTGLRIFLPMFGLIGLDYGWRFDDVPGFPQMPRGQLHFSIGMNVGEL